MQNTISKPHTDYLPQVIPDQAKIHSKAKDKDVSMQGIMVPNIRVTTRNIQPDISQNGIYIGWQDNK